MNHYMKMALQLAQMTSGQTGTNPAVGAVIVKEGKIIGMGAHLGYGEPHAERQALAACNTDPAGADMHVTLEPCSHHGKTPPCTEAIIASGIKKVHYGAKDENVKVRGHEVLSAAGIQVVHQQETEIDHFYAPFFTHLKRKYPIITLKCAMSLDGKLALSDGTSKWITGEAARHNVHEERHVHDGILVGGTTLLRDNPRLTARVYEGGNSPVPIILLGDGVLHDDLHLFNHDKHPIIFTTNEMNMKYSDRCDLRVGERPLEEVLEALYEEGISTLFVEGGASILTSFIEQELYDRIILYIAPKLFGESGYGLYQSQLTEMESAVQLDLEKVESLESDLKLTYRKA